MKRLLKIPPLNKLATLTAALVALTTIPPAWAQILPEISMRLSMGEQRISECPSAAL